MYTLKPQPIKSSTISSTPQKIRILFVLGTLWGENGITSHLKTLSLGLMKKGFEIAIVSDLANGEAAHTQAMTSVEDFRRNGISYFIVPFHPSPHTGKLNDFLHALKTLDEVIEKFKPEIIHLHSLSVVPYIHLLRLRYKFLFISTCHMEPFPSANKSRVIRLAHKLVPYLFGDRFIAISSELQRIFEGSLHVPTSNIKRIYHGIDSSYFYPPSKDEKYNARQSFNLTEGSQAICLIGRLSRTKGHDILIHAIDLLKQQGIIPTLLFAGKGYLDEEEEIRNFAIEHGVLDSIKFLGMTDSRKVLWASDILVLPSRKGTEAFPLVIPEAMLCGVIPIRTPASGAYDQIKHGVDGYIFPFEDASILAQHLKDLLEDRLLMQEISCSAIEKATNNFTLEHMIDQTIELFTSARASID
jgi:glycosyltransferase involved in cell wall biosynthesis